MFVCMPVWVCVCAGVAVVSRGCRRAFVRPWVMLSCISVPVFVSPRSPADRRPPHPICRVLLIVDHNAVTPWPFPTTGKLIVLLPFYSWPVIQPMREQHWGFARISTKGFNHRKHTHTTHPMISMTASDNNTLFVKRHTTKTHISFTARLGADTNFFTPTTAMVLVASGSSSHGDGSL